MFQKSVSNALSFHAILDSNNCLLCLPIPLCFCLSYLPKRGALFVVNFPKIYFYFLFLCLGLACYSQWCMAKLSKMHNLMSLVLLSLVGLIFAKNAPELSPFPTSITKQLNSTIRLACTVSEGSLPINFIWTRNGQVLGKLPFISKTSIEAKEFVSTLTIKDIRKEDAGNYSCSAQNNWGLDTQWSLLHLKGM